MVHVITVFTLVSSVYGDVVGLKVYSLEEGEEEIQWDLEGEAVGDGLQHFVRDAGNFLVKNSDEGSAGVAFEEKGDFGKVAKDVEDAL